MSDLKKWRKMATQQLLRRLESPNTLSPDELNDIKEVLKGRDKLVQGLSDTIGDAVERAVKHYDLDWEIQLKPLQATLYNEYEDKTFTVQHPRLYWPVRLDKGLMLGRNACDQDKPVLQNRDVLELGLRLAHATGAQVSSAFVLNDGASLLVSISMPNASHVASDTVNRFVYLLDNRTSEHGLRVGFGDTVLRCGNQLRMVSSSASVKMKHTKSLRERLAALVEAYEELTDDMTAHDQRLQAWARTPATPTLVNELVEHLTGVEVGADETGRKGRPAPKTILQEALLELIADQCREVGYTVWGVMNGVTYVATHRRHLLYPVAPMPELDHDLTYGQAAALITKAYDWLTQHYTGIEE